MELHDSAHSLGNVALIYRQALSGANLTDADLSGANLSRATLLVANLTRANLAGASLNATNNLTRAYNLTQAQLDQACGKPALPGGDGDLKLDKPCPPRPVATPPNRRPTP